MKASAKDGFVGGLIASVPVLLTLALLALLGTIPEAPYVGAYQATLGGGWVVAAIIGGLLFLLSGAIWGVLFAVLVPNPTVLKGFLFGLLPTIWALTFIPAVLTGGPLFAGGSFMGLLIPFVMNCVIWGTIVGWYCAKHADYTTTARAV
jgi:hypothetical protein